MDKQVELPKNVCFKGDNGMYLSAQIINGLPYLQFSSADIGDPSITHSIYPYKNGAIRIKSEHFGKFWRPSRTNWIYADADADSDDGNIELDTLFSAVKLGDDGTFALQNLGNYYYCTSLTDDGKENCLNASVPTINKSAHLQLEEAVVSRRIYNVEYDLEGAKIYRYKNTTLTTNEEPNPNSTAKNDVIDLKFSLTKERKWDSIASLKLGVKTTIEAGVPEVVGTASIQVQGELTESYTWGKSNIITEEQTEPYEVTVPPNTMVTVSLVATEAVCEVPFSYCQEDVLITGEKVVYQFDDGIYRGFNAFDFRHESSEQNL